MSYTNSWSNRKKWMKVHPLKNLFHLIVKMPVLKNKENNDCLDFDYSILGKF